MFKKLKFSFSVLFIFLFAINAFANTVFQGNVVIIGNLQVINQFSGFVTEWTVAGDATARTITLPLYNSGTFNCVVDWGDGTTSTITAYNSANRIHTYATDGVYYVAITGNCPSWSFNNTGDKLKITAIKQWGDINFSGFKYLSKGFYGCSNLTSLGIGKIKVYDTTLTILQFCFDGTKITSIPSGLFDNCVNVTDFVSVFQSCTSLTSIPTDLFRYNTSATNFRGAFNSCTSLTSIPTDLFRYNTSATNFSYAFSSCTSLTSIPTDLFRYNTSATTFVYAFNSCTSLTSIPTDLFRYNTSATTFGNAFNSCTSLTSIPTDLFRYNTSVTDFNGAFNSCTSLTSIPTDLFRYNTSATNFSYAFSSCTSLTSIPTDLFRYNTSATDFGYAFNSCTSLTSIPTDLFRYNTSAYIFENTFNSCSNLQVKDNIFYADGEQSTRFLNKSAYFTNCFYRTTFTGTQGTVPDLWNCDFGTGTPTKTGCFGGAGNTATSISNFADIPAAWR